MMDARARAGLTQAQVATRMKTTQTAIARLEGGRLKPSTRTLERYARATGHKLVIGFEPVKEKRRGSRSARVAR
jgi:transcriptional regulator with XRE-family HTH domain